MPLHFYASMILVLYRELYAYTVLSYSFSMPLHLYASTPHLYASTPLCLTTFTPLHLYDYSIVLNYILVLFYATPSLHLYASTLLHVHLYITGIIIITMNTVCRAKEEYSIQKKHGVD